MFSPGSQNTSMRFARERSNQILIYFDEYTRPDSVIFYLKVSDTASIAVELTELADYGWAGVLAVPVDIADGFYEYGVYLDGSEDAYGTGSAVVNDAYAPQGPAIVRGQPGSQIYRGDYAPDEYTPEEAIAGDWYVDEYTPAIYGPRTAEGVWGDPIPL